MGKHAEKLIESIRQGRQGYALTLLNWRRLINSGWFPGVSPRRRYELTRAIISRDWRPTVRLSSHDFFREARALEKTAKHYRYWWSDYEIAMGLDDAWSMEQEDARKSWKIWRAAARILKKQEMRRRGR